MWFTERLLSLHRKIITKATTSIEVWDVKYLQSPKSNAKTYNVSISLRKPLAPGEDFRGFAISGGTSSISFIEKREVEDMLSQIEVISLDGIPHNLHYMSRKVRSFGKYHQGP